MLPFKKILLPIDYSAACDAVMPYAKEFASHFSAEVTMVHAYGAEALAYSDLPLIDPRIADEAHQGECRRLTEFAHSVFPDDHVECFPRLGEAGKIVEEVVRHQGTDLVMMSTHGRGPVRKLLLGSVTSKVLHDVSAAVWTITGTALEQRGHNFACKTILCAVDESDETDAVLMAAAAMARFYDGELRVVHVVGLPVEASRFDYEYCRKTLVEAAQFNLCEAMVRLNLDAPHAVLEGFPGDRLREEAVKHHADLIVTGRGRAQATVSRAWSRLYPIIRESPCPVLSL